MRTKRSVCAVVVGAAALMALVGCGQNSGQGAGSDQEGSAREDISVQQESSHYFCFWTPVSSLALEQKAPLDSLSTTGRDAVSAAVFDDGTSLDLGDEAEWFIASESAEKIVLLRELDEPETTDGRTIAADHQSFTVSWVEASNVEPGWFVTVSTSCGLTADLGELSVPEITMDPAAPFDPASRELHLLVTEQQCNSGQDAEGRIEIVSIDEGKEHVGLVLGVRSRGGDQSCPENPATPFTVTLSDPLGERVVTNSGFYTPRVTR